MPDKDINNAKKEIEIYTEEDYARDESVFSKAESGNPVDWSAFQQTFQRLIVHDLVQDKRLISEGYLGDVSLESIQLAMRNPQTKTGWRTLCRAAELLMRQSPHFYRLNSMYGNMALYCWWIDLYDVKENANVNTIKKQYGSLAAKFENMHLKHEFARIMKCLPYQDIYCGLVIESSTDFFFQKIDFKICELFQIQDGLYNFRINLQAINSKELNAYPVYVQEAYFDFKEGRQSSRWYEPPADKQICIKLNSQWMYPFPILIGMIQDIIDLGIYKKLKLQSARTDNYKAIVVEVPIMKESVDKPLLTPETLGVFAEINRESMTDDIGLIHTLGSKGEAISFKDSNNTRNNVSDAVDELYNASGQTRELFNGSSSGTAVTISVENDAGFVYGVYRQLERWMNRYIKLKKYNKPAFKFYFYLLDVTIFNRDNVSKRYREAVTLGASCVDKWLATLDMTPSRTLGSFIVHKDIFDFQNNFIPLVSSYNGAVVQGEPGRPSAEETGEQRDVEGEKTRDGGKNDT